MVNNPHKKDHIKATLKEIKVFDAKQVDIQFRLSRHGVQGLETIIMLHGWFKTENKPGLGCGHAKHVIAVITTDVGNDFVLKVGEFRKDSLPFSFTAPFCINVDTEYGKWTFAPGHKGLKVFSYLLSLMVGDFVGFSYDNCVPGAVDMICRILGELPERVSIAQKTFFILFDPVLALGMFTDDSICVGRIR